MLEKRVWGLEFLLVLVELRGPGMSGSSRGLGVRPPGSSQALEQRRRPGSGSTGGRPRRLAGLPTGRALPVLGSSQQKHQPRQSFPVGESGWLPWRVQPGRASCNLALVLKAGVGMPAGPLPLAPFQHPLTEAEADTSHRHPLENAASPLSPSLWGRPAPDRTSRMLARGMAPAEA